MSLTPAAPAAPTGFAPGYAVQLSVTPPLASFAAPLTIRVAPPTAGLVTLFSKDGTTWQLLPRLAGSTLLAGTQAAFAAESDRSLGIQTRQPGQLLLDGHVLRATTSTTAAVRSFHPDRPSVYRVIALDTAGNRSPPSAPLVVVPSKRPAGLPHPLPRWGWQLLNWQQHGRSGSRPQAPSPPPTWYWRWAAWRPEPFRIRR